MQPIAPDSDGLRQKRLVGTPDERATRTGARCVHRRNGNADQRRSRGRLSVHGAMIGFAARMGPMATALFATVWPRLTQRAGRQHLEKQTCGSTRRQTDHAERPRS
jgi:hypothetical protein